MDQLRVARRARHHLVERGAHPVDPQDRVEHQPVRRGTALSCPGVTAKPRGELPFRGPPQVPPERKVDVHDEVRTVEASLDGRKRAEAIDDPVVALGPRVKGRRRRIDRRTRPSGKPLDRVDLEER
jgi:hypothetical protein